MSDDAGDRWQEFIDRIERLIVVENELKQNERDFLLSMRAKLYTYKARTFVSVAQLNWLTTIEAYYGEKW